MAAQPPKPSYDALAASLRAHRAEMRLMRDFFHDTTGITDAMQADVVRVAGGTTPQDLLFSHDPEGGEVREVLAMRSQARAEHRFVLAVQGLAGQRAEPY